MSKKDEIFEKIKRVREQILWATSAEEGNVQDGVMAEYNFGLIGALYEMTTEDEFVGTFGDVLRMGEDGIREMLLQRFLLKSERDKIKEHKTE